MLVLEGSVCLTKESLDGLRSPDSLKSGGSNRGRSGIEDEDEHVEEAQDLTCA